MRLKELRSVLKTERFAPRGLCTISSANPEAPESTEDGVRSETGSFAKAFDKYTGQENFAKLLRNSSFVRMGDPEGKIVEGVIYHVVEDDLYIDFGGKFNCVCLRPLRNGEVYTLGKKVRLVLHDTELSTRFLGAATDLTILEADATLIGLLGNRRFGSERGSVSENMLSDSKKPEDS